MDRIKKICSLLDKCKSFADVGCDHGYCTQYMLDSSLCDTAFITDISANSLAKAEKLLKGYIKKGVCKSVCCDGLTGFSKDDCEQVLIAGMGGDEIIKILKQSFIPRKFVLQPMKNADRLRSYLLGAGCKITLDDLFYDGKFYFIIKGEACGGTNDYTPREIFFGRDSLVNPVIKEFCAAEAEKCKARMENCASSSALKKFSDLLKLYSEVGGL